MIPSRYYLTSEDQQHISFLAVSINIYLWLFILLFFELLPVLPYLFGVEGTRIAHNIKGQTVIFSKRVTLLSFFCNMFLVILNICFLFSLLLLRLFSLFYFSLTVYKIVDGFQMFQPNFLQLYYFLGDNTQRYFTVGSFCLPYLFSFKSTHASSNLTSMSGTVPTKMSFSTNC